MSDNVDGQLTSEQKRALALLGLLNTKSNLFEKFLNFADSTGNNNLIKTSISQRKNLFYGNDAQRQTSGNNNNNMNANNIDSNIIHYITKFIRNNNDFASKVNNFFNSIDKSSFSPLDADLKDFLMSSSTNVNTSTENWKMMPNGIIVKTSIEDGKEVCKDIALTSDTRPGALDELKNKFNSCKDTIDYQYFNSTAPGGTLRIKNVGDFYNFCRKINWKIVSSTGKLALFKENPENDFYKSVMYNNEPVPESVTNPTQIKDLLSNFFSTGAGNNVLDNNETVLSRYGSGLFHSFPSNENIGTKNFNENNLRQGIVSAFDYWVRKTNESGILDAKVKPEFTTGPVKSNVRQPRSVPVMSSNEARIRSFGANTYVLPSMPVAAGFLLRRTNELEGGASANVKSIVNHFRNSLESYSKRLNFANMALTDATKQHLLRKINDLESIGNELENLYSNIGGIVSTNSSGAVSMEQIRAFTKDVSDKNEKIYKKSVVISDALGRIIHKIGIEESAAPAAPGSSLTNIL